MQYRSLNACIRIKLAHIFFIGNLCCIDWKFVNLNSPVILGLQNAPHSLLSVCNLDLRHPTSNRF